MMKKIISTNRAPAAIGPYSQAVSINDFIFCSGQIALTADGEFLDGSATEQTEQIMKNISEVLSVAGSDFSKVIKTTIFLVDINDYQSVNEVYGSYFDAEPPARSAVAVAALPKGAKVEIEVIASA